MTTITIQQFIDKYGDKDSIQWNYNHLDRYSNREAALQFLTARANASHCSSMSIICLDQYEDGGYTNKSLKLKSDEWFRSCKDWHKVADSFRDVMNGVEGGTHPVEEAQDIEREIDEQMRLAETITEEAQFDYMENLLPDGRTAFQHGCMKEKFGNVKVTASADWYARHT